ncbi:VIT family protein [Schaalia sp. ZJ405]|uniref:VIT1/CCC1 transporter family protein n=1 Tax=Schaalia sp. ZJ405 TaxID=2709403 RepID=UPI0013EDA807|nr:VIT family protein [Schaalia sp. ZJ405]QPK80603.1 VIT family protein [Schaalia sp. ZJ405]
MTCVITEAVPSVDEARPRSSSISGKLNWLRAGVLGANDGIVSISGLLVGVAAVNPENTGAIAIAGIAGIVSASLSMAVGEYVSVSTQRDSEEQLIRLQRRAIEADPAGQERRLARMWTSKGLSPKVAAQVARELTEKDAVGAHLTAEHNIDPEDLTSPWAAAFSSLIAFICGALLPLLTMLLFPPSLRIVATFVSVLVALALTGYVSAWLGDSPRGRAVLRLLTGGSAAMALTFLVGHIFGVNA